MKVSDLMARCLANEGVQYIFGVPGEENEDLLFSLEEAEVRFIPTRHEQGAAFMANVWGRLTGRAGVCLATLGPGATNLITGVADANLDRAPVVAITGQGSLSRLHHESHQYLDIVNTFRPITKWNTAVSSPEIVTEVVRKAFKVAESEKPGATHIELSEDMAVSEASRHVTPLPVIDVRRPHPDHAAIEEAIELLRSAKRPLIIAGNGAVRKVAGQNLLRLVEAFDIPVACTFMGKGAVSDNVKQSLLCVGLGFRDYVMEAIAAADIVMTVGYDISEYAPQAWNPDGDKKIIHVDFEPAEVYARYIPRVEIVGDIPAALEALHTGLVDGGTACERGWYQNVRARIFGDIASYDLQEGEPFTIPGTLNIIRDILSEDGLLISDVGSHKMWIARNFPVFCPNGCIISNGLASMGICLPGGIAAALVNPGRQIVAAMGDGGFLMNSQELETAKRLGTSFTAVVFNDNDYGLISWKQRMSAGKSISTRIGNPDFKAYAESFGIRGYRPESLSELKAQLNEAITSGEVSLVEVPVDASVNDRLIRRLNDYWAEH